MTWVGVPAVGVRKKYFSSTVKFNKICQLLKKHAHFSIYISLNRSVTAPEPQVAETFGTAWTCTAWACMTWVGVPAVGVRKKYFTSTVKFNQICQLLKKHAHFFLLYIAKSQCCEAGAETFGRSRNHVSAPGPGKFKKEIKT
jgi:uncharacterized protein YozE (UPF0346 family)